MMKELRGDNYIKASGLKWQQSRVGAQKGYGRIDAQPASGNPQIAFTDVESNSIAVNAAATAPSNYAARYIGGSCPDIEYAYSLRRLLCQEIDERFHYGPDASEPAVNKAKVAQIARDVFIRPRSGVEQLFLINTVGREPPRLRFHILSFHTNRFNSI